MLRKAKTPTGSHHNLSTDDDFEGISSHSYGLSSKGACSTGGGGGGGASSGNNSTKNEEDRHRRTIIIEKKNSSYGFTLQSYGIHYKREQELEMLTYVDHVEYDGPAYKAGMREGDVILSINGVDMEKADHSSLVAFIKECDSRMRMVVLFEDCVRKVSLHIRYIHLQNLLQTKVTELETLLQREREILEGKWKTHSLPARKKASQSVVDAGNNGDASTYPDDIYPNGAGSSATAADASRRALASKTNTLPITRTAISTENIGKLTGTAVHGLENFTPNAQVLLSYQYMDPTSRSNLKSSNSSGIDSTDYLGRDDDGSTEGLNYYSLKSKSNKSDPNLNHQPRSNCSTLSKQDQQQQRRGDQEVPHQSRHAQYYSNLQDNQDKPPKESTKSSGSRCRQSYYCNPCMGGMDKKGKDQQNNGDNVSLEAYDLAGSPSMCCDVHQCVPIRRRRSRHHHQNPQNQQQSTAHNHQQVHHQHSKGNNAGGGVSSVEHKCHHHQKHKHKHGGKCDEEQQRPQRPKSQSNLPSNPNAAAIMQFQKTHSTTTRYYDLNADMASRSRCSLHSCSHNDCCPSSATTGSYCTSLSADTLNDWQDQGQDLMTTPNHSGKNVKMIVHTANPTAAGNAQFVTQPQPQYQGQPPHSQLVTRFYHHTVQIQPTPDYQYQQNFQKPKSWDNLATKAVGGYGFGFGYMGGGGGTMNSSLKNTSHQYANPQAMDQQSICGYRVHPQQQHGTMNNNPGTRKAVYQHYGMKGSAGDAETPSYPSLPCQHVHAQQQQLSSTTTTTTIISSTTAQNNNNKSSENLLLTKCIKGDQCGSVGGGGGGGTVSGCSSNVANK